MRVAVTKKATDTVVGPFATASGRVYLARGYCLDASGNWYAQATATKVTADSNAGVVRTLQYTFNKDGLTACNSNALVL